VRQYLTQVDDLFQLFQDANKLGAVNWVSMDPALRETMLVKGDVDAITGFGFTSILNLEARGVKAEDIINFPYAPKWCQIVWQRNYCFSLSSLKKIQLLLKHF
jgi:hypothetical protein